MPNTAPPPAPEVTIKNLQAAFNGESNARAKYLEFAKKADLDGYQHVASLLRAAAHAEKIHAENHSRVLNRLGAIPMANIETPHVSSTAENLKAAIAGEEYERDVMYPEFIKEAEAGRQGAAVTSFMFALAVEAEHAKLYSEALKNLEQMRTKTTYCVCTTCGFTTENLTGDRCPVCGAHKDKFEKVD